MIMIPCNFTFQDQKTWCEPSLVGRAHIGRATYFWLDCPLHSKGNAHPEFSPCIDNYRHQGALLPSLGCLNKRLKREKTLNAQVEAAALYVQNM